MIHPRIHKNRNIYSTWTVFIGNLIVADFFTINSIMDFLKMFIIEIRQQAFVFCIQIAEEHI